MKKIFTLLLLLASFFSAKSQTVVISQVYGGGGNAGSVYTNDFIEIFNRGASAVNLNGWSVQYASATGTSWAVTNLTNITLQPGQYYLVQEAQGTGGTTPLPTADVIGMINMSGTAGKVALANVTTALSGSCPTAGVVDFVGFGSTANCFEGTAPTPAPSNSNSVIRGNNGCLDNNENSTDFTSVTAAPRNTLSALNPCSGSSPTLTVTGTINDFGNINVGSQSSSQTFNLSGSNLTGAPGNITITSPSTDFQVSNNNSTWGANTTIAYSGATLNSTPAYIRFTPQSTGLKNASIGISGGGGSTNIPVSGTGVTGAPPSAPVATAGSVITGNSFTANWNAVSGATGYFLDVYTLSGGSSTQTIAGWNFAVNTSANQTADVGNANNLNIQTVNPVATTGTVSWPSGPSGASGTPNPYSVSTNGWDNGSTTKYWQIDVNTTGATNITLSSLQGSSGTGPKDFKAQYKIGVGGTWTDITGGTIALTTAVVAGNLTTWGTLTDLPLPSNADNQALVSIRWIQTSNTSVNGSTVASGGTSRISAIYVKGTVGSSTPTYVHQNLSVGNVTSYNVTGLTISTTYYYVVRATNTNGTSVNSNEISVITLSSVAPTISATALTAFGNVCINTTAGPNSFTISGSNLTTANVTVAALTGYTYSITSGGTYTTTLSLTQPGGTYTRDIYVKFTPTAVISYNGNIVVAGGGAAASVNVAASGAGINTMPTVTTGGASAVTQTTATCAGTITITGCSAISAYGIEYSTVNGFANGSGTPVASSNLSGGNFSSNLSGLNSSTIYYYHAYATNAGGTAYGSQQTFTTASPNPTINVTTLAAFGNVCINTTTNPNSFTISGSNLTNANITVAALAGYTYSTTAAGTYTTTLSLTQPGGTYPPQQIFVKFTPTAIQSYNGNIAVAGGGVAAPVNVAASGSGVNSVPTLTAGAASAITQTTATAPGTITSTGCSAVTAYGIEYSLTNGFANGSGTQVASSNLSGGNFSSALSGLASNTTYYYKAYATNGGGTGYSTQQQFTTLPPVLTATALTPFGSVCINTTTTNPNSFTITGVGLTTANVTVGPLAGFTFATTSGGIYSASLSITHAVGAFSQTVYVNFNPTAVQTYNGNIPVGGGGANPINVTASGDGVNTLATVITGSTTDINNHSATLAGSISASGCSNVTAYGIEFSGINGFANGNGTKVPSTNIAGGIFTSALTGLVQGATYYYKAYAVNSGGISYGAQQSFLVTSIGNGFTLYPIPAGVGTDIRVTMDNLTPGYYGLLLFNSDGKLVYQKNMNIQANFINQILTIPASLPGGIYRIQLVNHLRILATKNVLIM